MARPAIAQVVGEELERLSTAGAAFHTDSARATIHLFSDIERAKRTAEIGRAYLLLESDVERGGRVAIVTAGPPGAGKSTALANADLGEAFRNIDADVIKVQLLQRAVVEGTFDTFLEHRLADGGTVRPLELASLVHRESVAIADSLTTICLRRGENVIIQGSLAWDRQPYVVLDALAAFEYSDLTILDVEVDLSTALERSLDRWWAGRIDASIPMGGRYVPRSLIESLYLPDGTTKCRTNADRLYELSKDIPTTLRRTSYERGEATETVQAK